MCVGWLSESSQGGKSVTGTDVIHPIYFTVTKHFIVAMHQGAITTTNIVASYTQGLNSSRFADDNSGSVDIYWMAIGV